VARWDGKGGVWAAIEAILIARRVPEQPARPGRDGRPHRKNSLKSIRTGQGQKVRSTTKTGTVGNDLQVVPTPEVQRKLGSGPRPAR